jgi:hypothetical protein
MVVHDLDVVCIPVLPAKADPPSVVHADAVLSLSAAPKSLEPVPGRDPKVIQTRDLMQKQQLPASDSLDRPETRHLHVAE